MEPQIPYNDRSVEEAAHSLLTMTNQPAYNTSQHQPSLTLGSFQPPTEALMSDLILDSPYLFGSNLSLDSFQHYFSEQAFVTANAAFMREPDQFLGPQLPVDMHFENGQEYGAIWRFHSHHVATMPMPLFEAASNVNSAPNLEPGPQMLQSSAHEQPFGKAAVAPVGQLNQPSRTQVVDCMGWNDCRESCTIVPDPAHPAIPSEPNTFWVPDEAGHPFSQHEPGPPERRIKVLSAAMELQAAQYDLPATGLDQNLVLKQSSCYDEEYETVGSEFMREYGQFMESHKKPHLKVQDGQKHDTFVGSPAHCSELSPPGMVGFEGGSGADHMTYLDRWLADQWSGLQEEMSLDYWPISDLRLDLDQGPCLDLPGPDNIDERMDYHTALVNADTSSNKLWSGIMDEMSPGIVSDDKTAMEKTDGKSDCRSEVQHSYEDSIDEGLATKASGSEPSRKGHYYPQNPSGHSESAKRRALRANARPKRQTRRAARPSKHRHPLVQQPTDGETEFIRLQGIIDKMGESYTWHGRAGWKDGRKRRVDRKLILSSKPWRSIVVRPGGKQEVQMYWDDAGAKFVGEVAYVGKLDLSDSVAVEMCENPGWHQGFLATWRVKEEDA